MSDRIVSRAKNESRKRKAAEEAMYALNPQWKEEDEAIREYWKIYHSVVRKIGFEAAHEKFLPLLDIKNPIKRLAKARELEE